MKSTSARLLLIGGKAKVCLNKLLEFAGGEDAKIVILPHASSIPEEVGPDMVETLTKLGAKRENVKLIMPGEELCFDEATAIYMLGGDQSDLVQRLGKEGRDLLKNAMDKGVLIAGTSAGAACVGQIMITGGMTEDGDKTDASTLVTDAGLALVTGLVVDTHFAERERFARPLAAIRAAYRAGLGTTAGVGLDEDTAILLFVSEDGQLSFEVHGQSKVWYYQPTVTWEPSENPGATTDHIQVYETNFRVGKA